MSELMSAYSAPLASDHIVTTSQMIKTICEGNVFLAVRKIDPHYKSHTTAMEMELRDAMEMESEISDDLLILVLARLPTLVVGRLRAVCRRWNLLLCSNNAFQRLTSNVPLSSNSAFLVGRLRPSHWINSLNNNLFVLGQGFPTSHPHRLSLKFLSSSDSINVVASCKSLLCCSKDEAPNLFYICNPATRTWIQLPPPNDLKIWDFIALVFDSSTRHCTLVIGRKHIMQEQNNTIVEIYDSGTNAWTKLQMTTKRSVCPQGEGLYSKGRFYWMNATFLGMIMSRTDVVALNVQDERWDLVKNPQTPNGPYSEQMHYWQLTGHDGRVVLVYNKHLCLWKLNEGDDDDDATKYKWSVLQILPRWLYGEQECPDFSSQTCVQVVVNGSGWILVFLPKKKMVLFDAEGKVVQSMQGAELAMFTDTCPTSVRSFEVNNIWWPF